MVHSSHRIPIHRLCFSAVFTLMDPAPIVFLMCNVFPGFPRSRSLPVTLMVEFLPPESQMFDANANSLVGKNKIPANLVKTRVCLGSFRDWMSVLQSQEPKLLTWHLTFFLVHPECPTGSPPATQTGYWPYSTASREVGRWQNMDNDALLRLYYCCGAHVSPALAAVVKVPSKSWGQKKKAWWFHPLLVCLELKWNKNGLLFVPDKDYVTIKYLEKWREQG